MLNTKRVATVLGSIVTGLLISFALAAPAQAHTATAWNGHDFAFVSSDHHRITWCDRERDGHRILAYYVTRNGQRHWTPWVGYRVASGRVVYDRPGDGRGVDA